MIKIWISKVNEPRSTPFAKPVRISWLLHHFNTSNWHKLPDFVCRHLQDCICAPLELIYTMFEDNWEAVRWESTSNHESPNDRPHGASEIVVYEGPGQSFLLIVGIDVSQFNECLSPDLVTIVWMINHGAASHITKKDTQTDSHKKSQLQA